MYTKIIVGHDLHVGGRDALALGQLIARSTGAELAVAGVFPFGMLPRGFEAQWREEEARIVSELERVADDAEAQPEAFPSRSPARGLHDLAEEIDADLVVVGSSRHSKLGRTLAGNVGLGLLQGATCAVGIAPRGYHEHVDAGIARIVAGFDGSPDAKVALEAAIQLARSSGAELKLVAVAEAPPLVYGPGAEGLAVWPELREAIEEQLRADLCSGIGTIPEGVPAEATLLSGDPVEQLSDAAAPDGDVLLLGSRAYGPLRRVLLGSVSSALVRSARCPVIVHPRGTEVEPATAHFVAAGSAR